MTKRITSLDVLGEVRRAQRILRRVTTYLEQQERAEHRRGDKRKATFERVQQRLAQGATVAEAFDEQG